mmetsp:Transcript_11025/g.16735  ORF Transcript_11025/g.16735 Transcript_11025/m.16735 type:complete len:118 (-) Transcript_11025:8-361(-)
MQDVLKGQLDAIKSSVKNWASVVVAYEPVWAVGANKPPSADSIQGTHEYIRSWFRDSISEEVSNNIRIQYGGLVTVKNASDLLSKPDIDGFLMGGASLKADFLEIAGAAATAAQPPA